MDCNSIKFKFWFGFEFLRWLKYVLLLKLSFKDLQDFFFMLLGEKQKPKSRYGSKSFNLDFLITRLASINQQKLKNKVKKKAMSKQHTTISIKKN